MLDWYLEHASIAIDARCPFVARNWLRKAMGECNKAHNRQYRARVMRSLNIINKLCKKG